MCIIICVYMCIRVHMDMCVHVCAYVYMCVHMCRSLCACLYLYVRTCVCVYLHTYVCVCMCKWVPISSEAARTFRASCATSGPTGGRRRKPGSQAWEQELPHSRSAAGTRPLEGKEIPSLNSLVGI